MIKISDYKKVPRNNEEELQSVVTKQVVSVTIKSSSRDFQFYHWVSLYIRAYFIISCMCLVIYVSQCFGIFVAYMRAGYILWSLRFKIGSCNEYCWIWLRRWS